MVVVDHDDWTDLIDHPRSEVGNALGHVGQPRVVAGQRDQLAHRVRGRFGTARATVASRASERGGAVTGPVD
jgi:hypothetical protein